MTCSMNIPLFDLSYTNSKKKDYILVVVEHHIANSTLILGPDVKLFEEKFAGLVVCKYAVGVSSGTDALIIGLKILGIKPGDEVISVSNSYIATTQEIALLGVIPVFVDVEDDTMNMNLNLVQAAITPKTKAIIPFHLYGFPVNIPQLRTIVWQDIFL